MLVFVLRTNNTLLYDGLNTMGWTKKREDNLQCNFFQTLWTGCGTGSWKRSFMNWPAIASGTLSRMLKELCCGYKIGNALTKLKRKEHQIQKKRR